MTPEPNTMLTELKKIFLTTTIVLLAVSALLAIIAILVSSNEFIFKILATTLLLSLFSLISTNNILRLSSEQKIVKITAALALLADIFWLIPWLGILWGLMPEYTRDTADFLEFIWNTVFSSLIISIASTIASSFIRFYHTKDPAILALTSLTIVTSTILSLFWLADIWFISSMGLPWQLYTIFIILLIFGAIATPILAKIKHGNAHREQQPTLNQEELRSQIEREVRAQIAAEQAAKQANQQVPTQPTEQPQN